MQASDVRQFQRLEDYRVPPGFRGRSALFVQLWWICQATLFAMSPQPLYAWRNFLLRLFGAKIGKHTIIRQSVRVTYPWNLTVGEYCQIGDDVVLYTLGKITVGDCAVISQRSYICTGAHDYESPTFDIYQRPITIEPEAWLATDVFVAPGVIIGRGAVIGVRSTVLSDMPTATICAGTPARAIRPRRMKPAGE